MSTETREEDINLIRPADQSVELVRDSANHITLPFFSSVVRKLIPGRI